MPVLRATVLLSISSSVCAFVPTSVKRNGPPQVLLPASSGAAPSLASAPEEQPAVPWASCLLAGFGLGCVAAAASAQRRLPSQAVARAAAKATPEDFFDIGAAAAAEKEGFSVANQPGVCAPMGVPGESYWDPAGLCNGIDEAQFRQYRKAELKHGRVCMTAIIGLLAQHTWRFNLVYPYDPSGTDVDFSSVPNGTAAMWSGPAAPWLGLLILVAGLHELNFTDEGREAGDFGDPLNFAKLYGLDPSDKSEKAVFQTFELNHGRLAMTAVLGTVLAEYATGLDAVEQWSYAGAAWGRTFDLTIPQGPVGPL